MLGSGKAASKAHGPLNSSLNVQTLGLIRPTSGKKFMDIVIFGQGQISYLSNEDLYQISFPFPYLIEICLEKNKIKI